MLHNLYVMLDFNVAGSYWLNPQYAFTLSKPDKDASDGKCTFIVSLMQEIRARNEEKNAKMTLRIFQVSSSYSTCSLHA